MANNYNCITFPPDMLLSNLSLMYKRTTRNNLRPFKSVYNSIVRVERIRDESPSLDGGHHGRDSTRSRPTEIRVIFIVHYYYDYYQNRVRAPTLASEGRRA